MTPLDELAAMIARFLAEACPDEVVGGVEEEGPLFRRVEVAGRLGRYVVTIEEAPEVKRG